MEFSRFKCHYLFYDRNDNGLTEKLESIVTQTATKAGCEEPLFKRPQLPYGFNDDGSAADSYNWLRRYLLPDMIQFQNVLVVGIGLGGLLAAKLQEEFATNINVMTFNAPLVEGISLNGSLVRNRVSIYSSLYSPLCSQWMRVAPQTYDVPWLQHGTNLPKLALAHLIASYMKAENIGIEVEALSLSTEKLNAM